MKNHHQLACFPLSDYALLLNGGARVLGNQGEGMK